MKSHKNLLEKVVHVLDHIDAAETRQFKAGLINPYPYMSIVTELT